MSILFLDLEDTLITPVLDGWHNTELINVDKIRSFISKNQCEAVHLFSFAIWNQREKELFQKHCQPMIESALGMKLGRIPTVDDDIIPACCEQKRIHPSKVDFSDMSAFWSKDLAFVLCIKQWFRINRSVHAILLDDAVEDTKIQFARNNLCIDMFNIDQLD